jgi:hypothetical protein
MPLPLLAGAAISAGAGLLGGLFGKGDEPIPYKGNYYSLSDLIKAGYNPYNATAQKENNSQVIQNQMAFDKAGARMRAANAGYNTNQILGQNDWNNEAGYVNSLLQANQQADQKAQDENNSIAKYIFGTNAEEKNRENYLNWKMSNEDNNDNFASRFLSGAGIGAQVGDYISKWGQPTKMSTGGKIPLSAGIPGRDSVPALLEPGEMVINKEAAGMMPGMLDYINAQGLKMKTGAPQNSIYANTNNEGIKDTYTIQELEQINEKNPELYTRLIELYKQGIIKIN